MRRWLVLTCRQFTEVANDYLDGTLRRSLRLQAHFHLSWCRPCQAFLKRLRQTVVVLGRVPSAASPPSLRGDLISRFHRARIRK